MTNRQLWRFLAVTFLLAAPLQWLAARGGPRGEGRGLLFLTMWVPAVAAFVSSGAARARAKAVLRRCRWGHVAAALGVGWSFILLERLGLVLVGAARWNEALFERAPDGGGLVAVHQVAMVLGVGPQGFGYFALNLLLSITLGSLVSGGVGGLGEELGWRGVLQPELERRFGPVRGTVGVGLLWGFWHLVVNLAGYNDAEHPVLNALVLFQLFTVALSFPFAWLTRRTGSVWPAAMAHGANNTLAAGFIITGTAAWGTQMVVSLGAAALVGALFAWRMHREGTASIPAGARIPAPA